jgi:hypothetical protein
VSSPDLSIYTTPTLLGLAKPRARGCAWRGHPELHPKPRAAACRRLGELYADQFTTYRLEGARDTAKTWALVPECTLEPCSSKSFEVVNSKQSRTVWAVISGAVKTEALVRLGLRGLGFEAEGHDSCLFTLAPPLTSWALTRLGSGGV